MEKSKEMQLDKAISAFKYIWKERFDLKEQIDMEKGLNVELQKAHFSESEFDFTIELPLCSNNNWQYNQNKEFANIDFSIPLFKQIEVLEHKLSDLQNKSSCLNNDQYQENSNDVNLLKDKIQTIKEEIKSIDMNVNNLLDKIVTFEDDELHELRTKKQHIDLQKKANQKSYF